jgi:hypothetical protein
MVEENLVEEALEILFLSVEPSIVRLVLMMPVRLTVDEIT